MRAIFIVAASIIAVIFALLVGPYIVPTSRLEKEIIQDVNKIFSGDVFYESFRFRFLPYPAFIIKELTITSKKEMFRGDKILSAKKVEGALSPTAFFRGKIVSDVVLKHAMIRIRSNDKGIFNADPSYLASSDDQLYSSNSRIRSVRIDDGRIFLERGDKSLMALKDVKGVITKIEYEPLFKAAYRISAEIADIAEKIDVRGVFSLDADKKIFTASQTDIFAGETRFNTEAVFQYGASPVLMDVHIISPSMTIDSLAKLHPALAKGLPFGISIEGPLVVDMECKGTKDNLAVKLHADGTSSKILLPHIFEKKSNSPFKFVFNGWFSPVQINMEELTVLIGEDTFKFYGSISRQPDFPSQINLDQTAFKSTQIFSDLVFLPMVKEVINPTLTLEIKGSLAHEEKIVSGRISAEKINLLGQTFSAFDAVFGYSEGIFSVNAVKGSLDDGTLSGNGSIHIGDSPKFEFSAVMNDIEASKLVSQSPLINGPGALVIKGLSGGKDIEEIKNNMIYEGTLIAKQAQIMPLSVSANITNQQLWDLLSPYVPKGFNEIVVKQLSDIGGTVKDLKASFEGRGRYLLLPKVEWHHTDYDTSLRVFIDPKNIIRGEGDVFLSREKTTGLITDPVSRSKIVQSDGRLKIPITVSGNINDVTIKTYVSKMENDLKGVSTASFMEWPLISKEEAVKEDIRALQTKTAEPLAPIVIPKTTPPAPATAAVPEHTPEPVTEKITPPLEKKEVVSPGAISPTEEKKVLKKEERVPVAAEPALKKETKKPIAKKPAVRQEPRQKKAPSEKMKGDVDEDVLKVIVGE